MRVFTAHARNGTRRFVPEGFSILAALLGPLWLLAHRCWIPAVLLLALHLAIARLLPGPADAVGAVALAVLTGLAGHDLRRWQLARRGFRLAGVVAARDAEEARFRHAASA